MKISFFTISSFIFSLILLPSIASAELLNIYPTDDSVAQLYDQDGISDWTEARDYQGELFSDPIESGSLDNTGYIYVRSDNGVGTYRIYRVSKVFDLSAIPESAEIISAKLNLYKTPSNNRGNIDIVVTSHQRQLIGQMQKWDWKIQNFGTQEFARNSLVNDTEYTTFDFSEAGLDYLETNFGEAATLGVLTDFDFDGIEPTEYIAAAGWYEVEQEGVNFDPYLEIEYKVEPETPYPLYTQI
jgi:hypothetical protein